MSRAAVVFMRRCPYLLTRKCNPWRSSNQRYSSTSSSSSPSGRSDSAPAGALPEGDDVDAFGHPRIPLRGHYEVHKCNARREWVERFTGASLPHVGQWWAGEGTDDSCSTLKLKGNAENVIGLVKIPLGVAGPLLVNGRSVQGYHLCPFATTEGALIASATRGSNAVTRAGGVWTDSLQQQLTRVPSFHCGSIEEAKKLWDWIKAREDSLRVQVKMYSQHAQLVALKPHFFGRVLMVQFLYDTSDAAGQNMTTSVTWHACKWILAQMATELPDVFLESFTIEGNLSADKKMAAMNLSETRGTAAQAEVWVPESILESVLKTSSKMMHRQYQVMSTGSLAAGQIGFNLNVPNIIAAVFAATGQDVACLAESSSGILQLEQYEKQLDAAGRKPWHGPYAHMERMDEEGGIYASLSLPSLVIGTVGGGTSLATQKECLQLMGCYGKGGVRRLAELIAGFALALELSLLAALASGHFVASHEKLGRKRPERGLKDSHLNREFFSQCLGERGTLTSWQPIKLDTGSSILSELTKTEMSKKVGHFAYQINYTTASGDKENLPVVIKSKALDSETYNLVNKMAQGCGLDLARLFEQHKRNTGFRHCHEREVQLAMATEPKLKKHMPDMYHVLRVPEKDVYAVVMEFLSKDKFHLLDSADDITCWTVENIKSALNGLAEVHSVYFDQRDELTRLPWLDVMTTERMVELTPVWEALLRHAQRDFPDLWTADRVGLTSDAITSIPQIWSTLESYPQTLIHNDCNPRNLCMRSLSGDVKGERLCLYDWELATMGVPQRDLTEFLAFVLAPTAPMDLWWDLLDHYRRRLEMETGQTLEQDRFLRAFDAACLDFLVNRVLMYTMAHTFKVYKFLPRVIDTLFNYLQHGAVSAPDSWLHAPPNRPLNN